MTTRAAGPVPGAAGGPVLRPARPDEAGALTALALRSKAYWGYDEAFMAACRDELTLDEDTLTAWRTVVAQDAGEVIGFATLEGEPPHGALGMLFVAPEAMRRGAGRLLYGHVLAAAGRLGFTRLSIDADPNAEEFYRARGAVTVGRTPSGSIPGRTLPRMSVEVPAGHRTEGRFAAPDGTELAYHVVGAGGGDPLVVLPGGPMRASEYLGDLGGLAARRPLVLLDLRGTGGSRLPADPATYACDRQVADVEALRAHLGLDRMDLLGHSAGADLAVLHAARHPDRVRTLTLAAPSLRAVGVGAEFVPRERERAALVWADRPWYPAAMEAFRRITTGPDAPRETDRDAVAPLSYGRWDAAARAHAAGEERQTDEAAAGVFWGPAVFDPAATKRALAALAAPVLLLAGEFDGGPRPAAVAAAAGLFPMGTAVVQPGGGHFPWLDDPEFFARTVAGFTG